jgi:hypothetical protein
MLEFSAKDFAEIAHNLGLLLGQAKQPFNKDNTLFSDALNALIANCNRLGMDVTLQHVMSMAEEMVKASPKSFVQESWGFRITNATLPQDRIVYYGELLYTTMRMELGAIKFRAIPREKNIYCSDKWPTHPIIQQKHPETIDELQRAGRCYAYGENTACVFHLMRVAEFYFTRVATSLQTSFDPKNWMEIGRFITSKMEAKYQQKSGDWKLAEPLYASILTDIQALSRAHRNPALHDLEKKYDDREGKRMLDIIEGFAEHVAANF